MCIRDRCIKVAIVDDDDLIRESLKIIVGSNEDIDVKGTFKMCIRDRVK